MERIVASAVVIILSQPSTHLKSVIPCNREIPLVEQTVKICTQKQTVSDLMWPQIPVGSKAQYKASLHSVRRQRRVVSAG